MMGKFNLIVVILFLLTIMLNYGSQVEKAFFSNRQLLNHLDALAQWPPVDIRLLYSGLSHPSTPVENPLLSISDENVFSDGIVNAQIILYSLYGESAEVVRLADNYAKACAWRPGCQLLVGKAYYALGLDDRVVGYWQSDPIWNRLIGRTAVTPRDREHFVELDRYYGVFVEMKPERAEGYHRQASIRRSRGDWQGAVPFFEEALAREPDSAVYLSSLGEALIVSGLDVQRGIRLSEEALLLAGNDMWVYRTIARANAYAGKCDRALETYELIANRFPNRSESEQWLVQFRTTGMEACKSHSFTD